MNCAINFNRYNKIGIVHRLQVNIQQNTTKSKNVCNIIANQKITQWRLLQDKLDVLS